MIQNHFSGQNMKNLAQLFLLIGILFSLESTERKKIVLNMIVKNEEKVMERSLGSVKEFIDYWVIVDTGSTDKTIEVIQKFFKDKPGELHQRPWVDFAHNRQEALELAKSKGDYILFMDADDTLTFEEGFELPELKLDFYGIFNKTAQQQWLIPRLVNAKLPWKWLGVLHEYMCCDFPTSGDVLKKISYNYLGGGARSQDPLRIEKDIQVLKSGLVKEPQNRRYLYYLATTCETGRRWEEALSWFKQRALYPHEGDPDEVFLSLYGIARLYQQLHMDENLILSSFMEAYAFLPTRIEPLFYILHILLNQNRLDEGYDLATKALLLPKRGNFQLTDHWIEDYGILAIYAEICCKKGLLKESLWAMQDLLAIENLPESLRSQVQAMRKQILEVKTKDIQEPILEKLKKIID